MTTYTDQITLLNDASYPLIGTRNAEVGDVIVNQVIYNSGGSNDSVSETGGYPALGANQSTEATGYATFSHTVAEADRGLNLYFYYWAADGIPYWNNIADYRGKFKVIVSAGSACLAGPSGPITSITISSAELATVECTINGPVAGSNCDIVSRALTEAQYDAQHSGAWFPGLVRTATRGTSYYFQAANVGFTDPEDRLTSVLTPIPYLATDMTVGVANTTVTADATTGAWSQTVTGATDETNYNNNSQKLISHYFF